MKKGTLIIVMITLLLNIALLNGCTGKTEANKADVRKYPVKSLQVKIEGFPVFLEYEGITGGSEVRKLSFKSSAKISKILVSKGQYVKKGEYLVVLDKTDLIFTMEASRSKMNAAQAQYEKAKNGAQIEDVNKAEIALKNARDNYNYYCELFDSKEDLYEKSSISKVEIDGIRLQRDNSKNALNSAEQNLQQVKSGSRDEDKQTLLAQLNMAKADYDSKIQLMEDASLSSEIDGYVVDVLCKEGELQPAGNPVILQRSENQVITVGMTDKDIKKIQIGIKAQVKIDDITKDGEIVNIVQMADKQTGTYSAEIKLVNPIDNNKFFIGQTVKVSIHGGDKNAMWIPISSILNDGEDYVYVVNGTYAVKKNVTLGDTHEDKVSVLGLKEGDKLIIQGMKNLKAGYQVIVK